MYNILMYCVVVMAKEKSYTNEVKILHIGHIIGSHNFAEGKTALKEYLQTSNISYLQTYNISCTLIGNKIVDHSDVVGSSRATQM